MLLVLACIVVASARAREPALPKDADKFTAFMADRFSEAIPDSKVKVTGSLTLELNPGGGAHSIYLDNIWRTCAGDRRHCREQVKNFVANMIGTMKESSVEVKAADIRVVVRPADYAAQARKIAEGKPERAPIVRPVAGDLWMVCVADSPHGIRVLQHADLTKLGLAEDQAIALALKNTAAALPSLQADSHDLKKYGLKFAAGDFYESSRMLLHDQWVEMSKSMGGHLVIAVPNNDFLIYGNGAGQESRAALSAFAHMVVDKAPKPMNATLFQWTEAGWEVVKPEGQP